MAGCIARQNGAKAGVGQAGPLVFGAPVTLVKPTAAAQLGIKPFEAADYLQSDEDCAQYLQACMDEAPEDAALFTKAVGDIARARGMMQLARETGITREGLYKALGEQGNPSFATVVKVMHALGLQFNVGARAAQG